MGNLKEILAARSAESQQRINAMADDMQILSQLSELRDILAFSQIELAKEMGISQPSVVAIEKRPTQDLKLSTLKRYVESMGGEIYIDIKLPSGKLYGFHL